MSRTKTIVFSLIGLFFFIAMVEVVGRSFFYQQTSRYPFALVQLFYSLKNVPKGRLPHGIEINRMAWEATYSERGLKIPQSGPREGYWGKNLGKKVRHRYLGWHEPRINLPGLIQIDRFGMQHVSNSANPNIHILIIGSSVAFGSYASKIERVYFSQMAELLAKQSIFVKFTVFASGGWTSTNEFIAFSTIGIDLEPDFVLFLNGINDLAYPDNSAGDKQIHNYLTNMRNARDLALANSIKVIFFLQPFLPQKNHLTPLEQRVLDLSLMELPPKDYKRGYDRLRAGLFELSQMDGVDYFDASGVFDNEQETTFADLFHFSDPGHTLLAQELSRRLAPILR